MDKDIAWKLSGTDIRPLSELEETLMDRIRDLNMMAYIAQRYFKWYQDSEKEIELLKKENEELKNQLTELSQAKVTIMTDSAAKGEL